MMSKNREEAVWQRVMAASAEGPMPHQQRSQTCLTSAQVLELLQQELEDACTYRTLAARVKQQPRQCLLQLAREEQRHARRLETVYYLMTGSRPCPDRPKAPCVSCTNEELRKRYQAEVAGAEQYRSLAEKAGSLSGIFRCLAREEEHHARMILNLLQMCL